MSVRIVYTLVYCVFDLQKQYKNENCIHRASWGGAAFLAFSFKLYCIHCMWQISHQASCWTTQVLAWVDGRLFPAGAPSTDPGALAPLWPSLLGRDPTEIKRNGPDHTVEPLDPARSEGRHPWTSHFCVTMNSFV